MAFRDQAGFFTSKESFGSGIVSARKKIEKKLMEEEREREEKARDARQIEIRKWRFYLDDLHGMMCSELDHDRDVKFFHTKVTDVEINKFLTTEELKALVLNRVDYSVYPNALYQAQLKQYKDEEKNKCTFFLNELSVIQKRLLWLRDNDTRTDMISPLLNRIDEYIPVLSKEMTDIENYSPDSNVQSRLEREQQAGQSAFVNLMNERRTPK